MANSCEQKKHADYKIVLSLGLCFAQINNKSISCHVLHSVFHLATNHRIIAK